MKQKLFALLSAVLFATTILQAQVTDSEAELRTVTTDTVKGWETGGRFSTNLSQTSLTNWSAGGENSLAVSGFLNLHANLKKGKHAWDNSLDLAYGVLGSGNKKLEFKKVDDKIDLTSKYGFEVTKSLYIAALLNAKTQMANGYDYDSESDLPISTYLAPGYVTAAIGIDYKPIKYFSAFISPITERATIVTLERLSNAGAFGVTAGETIRNEFGGYIRLIYSKADFKVGILENFGVTTKLDLFSNYLDKPQNIDVNWEGQVNLKVNKYITVNFNLHLIYDDDIKFGEDTDDDGKDDKFSAKTQFKEMLGVGLAFDF